MRVRFIETTDVEGFGVARADEEVTLHQQVAARYVAAGCAVAIADPSSSAGEPDAQELPAVATEEPETDPVGTGSDGAADGPVDQDQDNGRPAPEEETGVTASKGRQNARRR